VHRAEKDAAREQTPFRMRVACRLSNISSSSLHCESKTCHQTFGHIIVIAENKSIFKMLPLARLAKNFP